MCLTLSSHRSIGRAVAAIVIIAIAIIILVYFVLPFLNFGNISEQGLPVPLVSVARNWAGYVVASNLLDPKQDVSNVSASWIVPSVKDIGIDAYSSVWVGIGGQFDRSLIQVGTEQDFTGGSAKYYAWYEMLPNYSIPIESIQVSPGDQMRASISLVDTNTNLWSISIEDLTSNTKFQNNFTYDSQQLTAEWIVERPQVNNALVQLADFGSVTFTDCQASISGKTGGITDFSYNYVILDPEIVNNQSVRLVNVSIPPAEGGSQFSVTYIGVSFSPPASG